MRAASPRAPGRLATSSHRAVRNGSPAAWPTDPRRALQYEAALRRYLARRDESALNEGYEAGRRAFAEGGGVLDLTCLHGQILAGSSHAEWRAGQEFLLEALGPFEMAHRGFREAAKVLRGLNDRLEERIHGIAQSLHDDVQQLLAAASIAVDELARDAPPESVPRIANVRRQLDDVAARVRDLSHELSPGGLEDLGLLPALRGLAQGVSSRGGLDVVVAGAAPRRLARPAALACYRIAQEALTNAIKHARAKRVEIRLHSERSWLRMSIEDDGLGFDVAVAGAQGSHRLGLPGMRERIAALGGRIEIESAPGRGTVIRLSVPRAPATEAAPR